MTAEDLIKTLHLEPHPEGGAFRETYRSALSARTERDRSVCTAIYFLLRGRSEWHRVKHDEIYHFYFGAALELSMISPVGVFSKVILGTDFEKGERPQILIPGDYWQSATTCGVFTLIGCTVSPGFNFADFEISNTEKLKLQFSHLKNVL